MRQAEIINTLEVMNELWIPVAVLVQQADGTFSLRLILRDAWPEARGQATRVDPGQVVHVPVWYGLPWEPLPAVRIPIDHILAPVRSGPLTGIRR